MLAYYAVYQEDVSKPPPTGIFVMDTRTQDAMFWSHRSTAWQYNPRFVLGFLDDHNKWDRYDSVDRATAERITAELTKASAGFVQDLPDERTIYWIFECKGDPPTNRD
jgi:hypothetical protein